MFEQPKIAPSILSADFMNLQRDLEMLEDGGADYIHIDVMDGHFVENLTLGVPFVKQIKATTSVPLDVHLMISNPLYQLPWYLEAGSDIVTIHYEACEDDAELAKCIESIRAAGASPAISIKPDTAVDVLDAFIEDVDMVLIMSVYPGFSGQSYIEGSEDRVAQVVKIARDHGVSPRIEVDGGISAERTAGLVAGFGADVLVAGSGVFKADDPRAAIAQMREAACAGQKASR